MHHFVGFVQRWPKRSSRVDRTSSHPAWRQSLPTRLCTPVLWILGWWGPHIRQDAETFEFLILSLGNHKSTVFTQINVLQFYICYLHLFDFHTFPALFIKDLIDDGFEKTLPAASQEPSDEQLISKPTVSKALF